MLEQRKRRGEARRARADVCWGRGRRLVVVDLENIAGGPCHTEACAEWVRRRLADEGLLRPGDHVTVAVDEGALPSVVWVWRGSVCRWGHGKDGADLALVDVLADRVHERFDEVVVASGDGIFADTVLDLVGHGVRVVVASHAGSLNPRLSAVASEVVLLSPAAVCA
jgi:hypothetical protein